MAKLKSLARTILNDYVHRLLSYPLVRELLRLLLNHEIRRLLPA